MGVTVLLPIFEKDRLAIALSSCDCRPLKLNKLTLPERTILLNLRLLI